LPFDIVDYRHFIRTASEKEAKFLFKKEELYDLKTLLKKKNTQHRINNLAKKYRDKKVIIYGGGKLFYELQNNYDLSKLNIIAVADMSFLSMTESCNGYKAIKPEEINSLNPDVILIATQINYNIENYLKESLLPKNSRVNVEPIISRTVLEKLDIRFIKYLRNSR